MSERKAIGLNGIFKGKELRIEGLLDDVMGRRICLPELAMKNIAAFNALEREKYKITDAPFYYGKMGALGYIIAEKYFKFITTHGKEGE